MGLCAKSLDGIDQRLEFIGAASGDTGDEAFLRKAFGNCATCSITGANNEYDLLVIHGKPFSKRSLTKRTLCYDPTSVKVITSEGKAMRYSANHKLETRERLLQSSAVSAKQSGFSTVGVDGLMKAIGLSGGAFYSHFSSKDELFAAIVERELGQSLCRLEGDQDLQKLDRCLRQYLSMAHVESAQNGCALPALGAEIARSDDAVRQLAQDWICRLQQNWAQTLGSESLAWAILSQCVGALVVARMLATPDVQRTVLKSSYDEIRKQIAEPRT
jgi:TetR/AcrR family transcriptional repressor of nem operon